MSNGNIFISYRRGDASGHAGRIYDRLNLSFPGRVFRDVASISIGGDFLKIIEEHIGTCKVFIELIGDEWATMKDHAGRRRLDQPNDFVRIEVATALRRGIPVIPILVDGAQMPDPSTLPEDLAALTRYNALEMTESDFDHDVERLVETLEAILGATRNPRSFSKERYVEEPRRGHRSLIIAGAFVAGLLVVGAIGLILSLTVWGNKSNQNATTGNVNGTPVKGPASPEPTVRGTATETPTPTQGGAPLKITATASSFRLGSQADTYAAAKAVDGDRTTAWIEGAADEGLGEWIRFDFDREVNLHKITLLPGYFKSDKTWSDNNRLASATAYFSDGSSRELKFTDRMDGQKVYLGSIKTKFVRLVIKQTYHGVDGLDTPISEAVFEWDP
jgi:F5/8 type C domain/TIR domain